MKNVASTQQLIWRKLEEVTQITSTILSCVGNTKFFRVEGNIGAGKTTLIKELCHQMGVKDRVKSPTYSIVNEYLDKFDNPYYHFDFYRINNETEASDIGIEEYFYSGNYCFLEWSSRIPNLLPVENYITIDIETTNVKHRIINLKKYE